MTYSVSEEKWSGESVWVLRGPDQAKATILPVVGANLIELELAPAPGKPAVSIVNVPPDVKTLRNEPSHFGSPVLFPFPSRVSEGRFSFAGGDFQLDVLASGHALHGFVLTRSFTVTGHGAGPDGAWVSMAFDGATPDIMRQFPFPFSFDLTYRLDKKGLTVTATGRNTGGSMMPVGFGWHPYFNMPLADGKREACLLQVPCNSYWELAPDLVPTGQRLPVSGKLDMRKGIAMGSNTYDDILSGVERDKDGWSHASYTDPAAGIKTTLSAGPTFREWVIYAPPHKNTVCLEPYTCAGNAFNMQAKGVDAGVITLAPGEIWSDSMRVSVSVVA